MPRCFSLSDFWKTKDSSQWTDEEVSKMLERLALGEGEDRSASTIPDGTARRWSVEVASDSPAADWVADIRGGGGGYPGGGGGYPGGGGGYPQRRRLSVAPVGNNGDPSQNEPMNLTIRWASAAPIQQP